MNNNYACNSAGRKMISMFPLAKQNETISSVLARIRRKGSELKTVSYVYVINSEGKLEGVVAIKKILSSDKKTKIKDIMIKSFISVSPETSCEKTADLAIKHNIKAVPVVKKGKLLGVVNTDAILTTLNNALRDDVIHFAGIHKSYLNYENTLKVPFFEGVMHRLPWLLIGLAGITITAFFISTFEELLQEHILIAFFIPAIVYMSGALGAQHQTLFVRDIAVLGKELDIKHYFLKVMSIGLTLGIIIGSLVFLIISLIWNDFFIACVIGISMMITFIVSSFTSLTITYLINKSRTDPALGSGPFATIISDVSSVIIYFIVVSSLLSII